MWADEVDFFVFLLNTRFVCMKIVASVFFCCDVVLKLYL